MTIEGLENSAYYVFNPIWVRVTDLSEKLHVTLAHNAETFSFSFDPLGGEVVFDLARSMRGILPNIINKTNFSPLPFDVDGSYRVTLTFKSGGDDAGEIKKWFILGGKDEFVSNISPQANLDLTDYVWDGYPTVGTTFVNGQITVHDKPPKSEMNKLPVRHDCKNIFLMFRNLLGGFSFYLFEDFTFSKENKHLGYYLLRQTLKDSGTETKVVLTVRGQIMRRMYETIEHLAQSDEIYVQNFDNQNYFRVSGKNNINFNYKKATTDVEMRFEVITSTVKSR